MVRELEYELGVMRKNAAPGSSSLPLLFNLVIRGLPGALGAVPRVEHAIYADDITLWCRAGSDGEIEEHWQRAADFVDRYAREYGLHCATEKSQLLILRNPRERLCEHIDIRLVGMAVPKPEGRGNKPTLDRVDTLTTQVSGMLRRIRNKKHGIREKEAAKLVRDFIISRLTSGTPYLQLNKMV
ncbi:hypothetical protein HPB47_016649 [Ixodes persulcatus]|uniref:Uncharacterized protein n=1 Tax=Ixodes persulcatus TaxID=34615 RepID=A0AC60QQB8_IXOPE|nr:hypothetical protein HPB47_016649 [Ixodes persulcatus]